MDGGRRLYTRTRVVEVRDLRSSDYAAPGSFLSLQDSRCRESRVGRYCQSNKGLEVSGWGLPRPCGKPDGMDRRQLAKDYTTRV